MIQARELRIGNWVKSNLTEIEFQVTAEDIVNINEDPAVASPIPLTDDSLILKFGFVHDGGLGYKAPTNTAYWWCALRNGFMPSIWNDRTIISDGYVGCKSVHQLQNLYFALTATELSIKQI